MKPFFGEHISGVTVELIQPHATSWIYPKDAHTFSSKMGIIRLQHIGLAVKDQNAACARFEKLFGLECRDSTFAAAREGQER